MSVQVNFTGHNMEITPALRLLTEEKINRLEKHFENITAIHVLFSIEKLSQIAEATIFINKGEIHGRAETIDMYTSVDELMEKLNRQLVKHKEKSKPYHRD